MRFRSRPVLVAATIGAAVLTGLSMTQAAQAVDRPPAKVVQFFVAPNGSDSAAGTKAHPWATVTHARDYIRSHHLTAANRMTGDITVNLRAGTYPVANTVQFTDQDSGSNGHSVVYRSYDGPGRAQLAGAKRVTGWQQYQGSIYRADVGTSWQFSTLYENGKRADVARYPNRTSTTSWAPYLTTTGLDQSNVVMGYKPGDVNPSWNLTGAQVVIWSGGSWSWFTDTVPIAAVSTKNNQITLQTDTRYPVYSSGAGSRYFIQNSLSLLDAPGEFYLDHANGYLYYWPRGGDIDAQTIMAPTVRTVLSVAGSSAGSRAHDLVFDGLAVTYSDFSDWYRFGWVKAGDSGQAHKYPSYDRQIEMPVDQYGAVLLTNTHDVTLRNMDVSETGYTGVYLLYANDHDTVSGSVVADTGGGGIKVEGRYPGEGNVANHNVFTDNYIHDVGETVEGDAAGVKLMNTSDNEVSHSVIENSPRYAVAWEAQPGVAPADDYSYGNTFSYLRIAHMGRDSGDTGAVYAYGVSNSQPYNVNTVSQVTVDDVNADPSMPDTPPSGINMDSGTCGQVFDNVQVTNAQNLPFNSGDPTCYQYSNVSWTGTFDPSGMRYSQIGVLPGFPYPVPAS